MKHSNSVNSHRRVVVGCDEIGLTANGNSFELAQKVISPKDQGGYQLATAFKFNLPYIILKNIEAQSIRLHKIL